MPTSRFTDGSGALPGAGFDGIGLIPIAKATARHPQARGARDPALPA